MKNLLLILLMLSTVVIAKNVTNLNEDPNLIIALQKQIQIDLLNLNNVDPQIIESFMNNEEDISPETFKSLLKHSNPFLSNLLEKMVKLTSLI